MRLGPAVERVSVWNHDARPLPKTVSGSSKRVHMRLIQHRPSPLTDERITQGPWTIVEMPLHHGLVSACSAYVRTNIDASPSITKRPLDRLKPAGAASLQSAGPTPTTADAAPAWPVADFDLVTTVPRSSTLKTIRAAFGAADAKFIPESSSAGRG
ncbi:hypothetical protein JMJ56_14360 [Belnapia sp. T18]|uniref:Uncharacterized protein n=1 Tax=Belnapia arida TaxID=2804533 RepID=A0ABS1U3E4_9PROT|nr:hypothetical protein [Belnapia arida]MBL6079198.1 hypothetical protein [Belnapia arida]